MRTTDRPLPTTAPSTSGANALAAVAEPAVAPAALRQPATATCRRCGEPVVLAWATVVSSHATSQGAVSYVRCPCGGLAIRESLSAL